MAFSKHRPERRENSRHPVRSHAYLESANGRWTAHLLDMSTQGARLAILGDHDLAPGDEVNLAIELEDIRSPDLQSVLDEQARKLLRLKGNLVHLRDHMLGVEYQPVSGVDQVLLTLLLAQPE